MTKRLTPLVTLTPACQLPWQRSAASVCLAATTLLAACTSTPLPPWVPAASRTPAANSGAPNAAGPGAAPESVQTFPIAPPAPLPPQTNPVGAPSANVVPQTTSESPAVAARFSAPSVVYGTPGLQPGRSSFTTTAESSVWLHTQARAAAGASAAVVPLGRSQRGTQLEALVISRSGGTDPASLAGNGRPALLVMARELTQGLLRPALDRINVVVLPNANPDAPQSPAANRDHLALTAGETQAVATLMRDYRPAVVVDVREYEAGATPDRFTAKFGAVQKFDLLFQYATTSNTPELLTRASEEWFRRPLLAALTSQKLSMEWAYTNPADPDDRKLVMGGPQPDSIRNVSALKNSVGLIVQSRGAGLGRLNIQRRVHTHVTALSSVLTSAAQRAADLVQVRAYFDKEVSALACTGEAVVQAAPVAAQYDLQVLDPVTGADKVINVDWDSSLALNRLSVRNRPCGYWLAASAGRAVERLQLHGVKVLRVAESGGVLADTFLGAAAMAPDGNPSTGTVRLLRGLLDVPRGSFYVPLNQPMANLVMAALEPDTPFSFAAQRLVPDLQASARVMAPPVMRLEDLF